MRATNRPRRDRAGGETKPCARPGCSYLVIRRAKVSASRWATVRFCSVACGNKVKNPLIAQMGRPPGSATFNRFRGSVA